jgi:single-strand DNA-binding protein
MGRLTADPELKQAKGDMTVLRFNMAIDRGKDKNGESRGADFPSCVAFGRTAEVIAKYFKKGHLIGIVGRIQTGSYDGKDGKKEYVVRHTKFARIGAITIGMDPAYEQTSVGLREMYRETHNEETP